MARRRSNGITSLAFNQDQDCFTCCLTSGMRVYNVEPLVEKAHYSKEELGEVSLCEMVFRTNWLLLVKARRPCRLMLLDDKKREFRAEVHFKSPIRALRARKDKVAVVLASSVQVLALPSLIRIALVRTRPGGRALVALASDANAPHMLAATAERTGSLQLLDVTRAVGGAHSSSPTVMGCHRTELVCLSISSNGAKLATASERGTIIRIWDTHSKHNIYELRRGSDYADVYCITFDQTSGMVCCVSDKGTLHVWRKASNGNKPEHIVAARSLPEKRAYCAFMSQDTAVVICEDGTFHKFKFTSTGSHRNDFEYFLQVGDDDEFLQ